MFYVFIHAMKVLIKKKRFMLKYLHVMQPSSVFLVFHFCMLICMDIVKSYLFLHALFTLLQDRSTDLFLCNCPDVSNYVRGTNIDSSCRKTARALSLECVTRFKDIRFQRSDFL